MFPTQEVTSENLKKSSSKISIIGKSFFFNFKTGEFELNDGKAVKLDGYEALKIWIKKVLYTTKNKYEIYEGSDYGVIDFRELITSHMPYPFIKAEIEREVKEALLKNTAIKSVENFSFEREKRLLKVNFDCQTIYGTVKSEVVI